MFEYTYSIPHKYLGNEMKWNKFSESLPEIGRVIVFFHAPNMSVGSIILNKVLARQGALIGLNQPVTFKPSDYSAFSWIYPQSLLEVGDAT